MDKFTPASVRKRLHRANDLLSEGQRGEAASLIRGLARDLLLSEPGLVLGLLKKSIEKRITMQTTRKDQQTIVQRDFYVNGVKQHSERIIEEAHDAPESNDAPAIEEPPRS